MGIVQQIDKNLFAIDDSTKPHQEHLMILDSERQPIESLRYQIVSLAFERIAIIEPTLNPLKLS
jgi:hypothetical protein